MRTSGVILQLFAVVCALLGILGGIGESLGSLSSSAGTYIILISVGSGLVLFGIGSALERFDDVAQDIRRAADALERMSPNPTASVTPPSATRLKDIRPGLTKPRSKT